MATTSVGAYNTLLYYCALRGIPTSRSFSNSSTVDDSISTITRHSPQKGGPLNPSYMDTHLNEAEEQSYRAAGVLPIAFFTSPPPGGLVGSPEGPEGDESEGESEQDTSKSKAAATSVGQGKSEPVPYVLLGCEKRYRDRKAKEEGVFTFLNLLGGKREVEDSSAAHTAWREFWEESGQLLSDEAKPFLEHFQNGGEQRRVLWFSHGKYALFIHHLPYPAPEWTTKIADTYRQMETREKGSEMDSLHWVPLPALLEAARGRPVYDAHGTPYPVFRFSVDIVRHLERYLGRVASGKPHAVPSLWSGSPVRRAAPSRSGVSASPQGGSQRGYHTTPDRANKHHHRKQQRARTPSPAAITAITASQPSTPVSSSSLSAHARPFYPRGHPRPRQIALESEASS